MPYKYCTVAEFAKFIPDLDKFIYLTKEFFDAGGILAGGALTRAIQQKSIVQLFDIYTRECEIFEGVPQRVWVHSPFTTLSVCDADFFFQDQKKYEELFKLNKQHADKQPEPGYMERLKNGEKLPFFVFKMCVTNYKAGGHQFVPVNLIHPGKPLTIDDLLDTFDFTNCKIATDGETVIYDPRAVELELNRELEISRLSNNLFEMDDRKVLQALDKRLTKYLDSGRYTNFSDPEKLVFNAAMGYARARHPHIGCPDGYANLGYSAFRLSTAFSPVMVRAGNLEVLNLTEIVTLLSANITTMNFILEKRKEFKQETKKYSARLTSELTSNALFARVKEIDRILPLTPYDVEKVSSTSPWQGNTTAPVSYDELWDLYDD